MIRKLERVALNVTNLENATALYSRTLGITFEKYGELVQPDGTHVRFAISSGGLELLQEIPPRQEASMRSFHYRVDNLDEAKKHIEQHGGVVLGGFNVGAVKELGALIGGIRMFFLEYEGDDIIAEMNKES